MYLNFFVTDVLDLYTPKFAAKLSLGVPALLTEAGGCGAHALSTHG
jgi:hypothetical protein